MMTVEGGLKALELLYSEGSPDWFVLLGLSDYPIAPASKVLADLSRNTADVLLDYREVSANRSISIAENPVLEHFDRDDNRELAWGWYRSTQLWIPWPKRRPDGGWRIGRKTTLLPFEYPYSPFDDNFKCYNGSAWITGSRRTAEFLINPTPKHMRLRRHYRRRAIAEETYYQTVICNSDLVIDRHTRRFEKWNGGGAHPQWLGSAELDEMIASGCHFARKFKPDDPVLDQIDEIILGKTIASGEANASVA